jgi:hypothetical protein
LIKPLSQIAQVKGHKIDDGLACDPQPLALFYFERRA